MEPLSNIETPSEHEENSWTSAMNQRRCHLVDKDIDGTLSTKERAELERLQSEFVAFRQKVAPLPLDDLRKLHQDLLEKASRAETGS